MTRAKRALDVLGSGVALLIALPVLANPDLSFAADVF